MIWKIINTNSNYEISDTGQIRVRKTQKIMKPQIDKDGYLYVKLYNNQNKKYIHYRIHRLVLEHFDRPPKNNEECHHKDGNRQNNNIENLMWTTRQENDSFVEHKVNNGSYPPKAVIQMDLVGNILNYYESMSEASRQTGCQISKISLVCSGKRHTTGGYKWAINESSTTNA